MFFQKVISAFTRETSTILYHILLMGMNAILTLSLLWTIRFITTYLDKNWKYWEQRKLSRLAKADTNREGEPWEIMRSCLR